MNTHGTSWIVSEKQKQFNYSKFENTSNLRFIQKMTYYLAMKAMKYSGMLQHGQTLEISHYVKKTRYTKALCLYDHFSKMLQIQKSERPKSILGITRG